MTERIAAGFQWHPEPDTIHRAVVSQVQLSFGNVADARLTIAVPTYRRGDLLIQTVHSVLTQTERHQLALIIIDNDPESLGHADLLTQFPELADFRFAYYRNSANIGMFGNWNKCIDLCETEWLSILNDDDLIDPTFTTEMLRFLDAHPGTDAAICSKRWIDQRTGTDIVMHEEDGIGRKMLGRFRFGRMGYRRITPRSLFFGNVIGNSVGLIIRTAMARQIGGFRAAEFPSADYYFNVRLAHAGHMIQMRRVLASVRIAENESCKPETVMGFLSQGYDLQRVLARDVTPRWWARLIPRLQRIAIDDVNALWRTSVTVEEVAMALQTPIARRPSKMLKILRNILPDL